MESLTPDERMSITLNNVVRVLQSIFDVDYEITESTKFMLLCSENMNKASLICERVKKDFNVEIGFVDLQTIDTVKDLFQVVYEKSKRPGVVYLATERDTRRNDLLDIISQNKLTELDSSLSGAKDKLKDSLKKIEDCSTPLNQIGHKGKYEWLNKFLNAVDTKISRDELIKVITTVDENTKDGFANISKAIEATNGCIDAISKLMLLIIHIENDLYSTADETSNGISAISEELLKEGVNVEGLSRIAEREREKRLKIQAKMRDSKNDVYGKIEFLNKVNLNLRTEFIAYQDSLNELFESANHQLNANFENVKSVIDTNLQEGKNMMQSLQNDYSLIKSKLEEKMAQILLDLTSNQKRFHQELNQVIDEQKQYIQNDLKKFVTEWDKEKDLLQKQYSCMENKLADNFEQTALKLNADLDSGLKKLQEQLIQSINEQEQFISIVRNDIKRFASDWDCEKKSLTKKSKLFAIVITFVVIIEAIALLL